MLAQSMFMQPCWKGPGRVSWVGVPGAWGSAEGVWGPPWSSSRCGTRLWCRAPCHRPLCWGAAGGLRRTPARSLHHRCCRHSGPVGSSGRARTAQSTEGTRGIQAWASRLPHQPPALGPLDQDLPLMPGSAVTGLRGLRSRLSMGLWAPKPQFCLFADLQMEVLHEISFVKVSAD